MLELIDLRRAQTGDQSLGSSIEKQILDQELMDLEIDQVPVAALDTRPQP